MYLNLKLLCITTLLSAAIHAQTKQHKIAALMQAYNSYNMFDGTVLVAQQGKIVYQGAFGMANREWNIPNSLDTKFMIGSISKPITAMLMLIQVQKGLVALDKTVADYLPEFTNKPAGGVTIAQLLSNTGGMPNYDIIKDFFPKYSRLSFKREEYVKLYMDSALAFTPGSRFFYSSWGFFTLGYIMERVTGKSYAALIKQDIFDKLQMNNTRSYHHTQVVPKRASGYDYAFGGFTSGEFRDQSNTMGAGDLYGTVGDLFKLHLGLQNNVLLNKELTQQMFTPGLRPARYGFGWFNQNFKYTDVDSIAANYHLGRMEGFIGFMLRIPATNSCIIFLCNSSPTDFFGITKNLLRILHNKPTDLKQPIQKKVEQLITTVGATKAMEAFQQMRLDTAHYYVDWISMHFITEQLYDAKRYEEARIVAENNCIAFADRDLIHYMMGNVYAALNKKEAAIAAYKKALAITPNYVEAQNRLQELTKQ
jgi:CubicO group peptidase (beta-lactamase class C family)